MQGKVPNIPLRGPNFELYGQVPQTMLYYMWNVDTWSENSYVDWNVLVNLGTMKSVVQAVSSEALDKFNKAQTELTTLSGKVEELEKHSGHDYIIDASGYATLWPDEGSNASVTIELPTDFEENWYRYKVIINIERDYEAYVGVFDVIRQFYIGSGNYTYGLANLNMYLYGYTQLVDNKLYLNLYRQYPDE